MYISVVLCTRVWCCFEIYKSLLDAGEGSARKTYDVYTACDLTKQDAKRKEGAIGLVDGIAAADEDAAGKQKREVYFPFELAKRSLAVKLQISKASVESDRTRILNAIVGAPPDSQPPETHEQFDRMNSMLVQSSV